MKLLTKEITNKLPLLGSQDGKNPKDVPVVIKFFDPMGSWTWYVTEGEEQPDGDWMFFGLVRGFESELGYFCLSELQSVKAYRVLGIERDRHFGEHSLAEVQDKHL